MGKNKGTAFEREVCKALSLWWTGGGRDDVFWRSDTSGARAKTRSKVGKETFGQYGDIQASDPIGQPLIDLVTVECKRGYSDQSFQDLIDRAPKAVNKYWATFIAQAHVDHVIARSWSWILITKRDRQVPLIVAPSEVFERLSVDLLPPSFSLSIELLMEMVEPVKGSLYFELRGMRLNDFLAQVSPTQIMNLRGIECQNKITHGSRYV